MMNPQVMKKEAYSFYVKSRIVWKKYSTAHPRKAKMSTYPTICVSKKATVDKTGNS